MNGQHWTEISYVSRLRSGEARVVTLEECP
jgi:hypothetical protein